MGAVHDPGAGGQRQRVVADARLPPEDTVPRGLKARAEANLEAIRTLRSVEASGEPASVAEVERLAAWSGWGALSKVFDPDDPQFASVGRDLRDLLSEQEWAAARRSTLNAHYTAPGVVPAMWQAADGLGFIGGRVLEPGCGPGGIIGRRPATLLDTTEVTGVELDPITAALYPNAEIRNEGFEVTPLDGGVDLVIGNVPFGDYVVHDPVHNPTRHSIHNHFLIKSMQALHPGGLAVAVTSRYTLDARNPAARRELAAWGDLVGAVRLPSRTHAATAGTDVVTDLLILRRREPDGRACHIAPWDRTVAVDTESGPVTVNEVFEAHPEWVIGELGTTRGAHSAIDLAVTADLVTLPARLASVIDTMVQGAQRQDLRFSPGPALPTAERLARPIEEAENPIGSIVHQPGRQFFQIDANLRLVPFTARPKKDAPELTALCDLRDRASALLDAQLATASDTPEIGTQRDELRSAWERYVARWGPLNRSVVRSAGADPETGEEQFTRRVPPMGGFRSDPGWLLVAALEDHGASSGTATPAAMLTRRVVRPEPEKLGADDPADALAISLNERGRVDIARIAQLLAIEEAQAVEALAGMVFRDPVSRQWEPAGLYLSGDVRTRLNQARTAARSESAFEANVAALEEVQPADLVPTEIDARLGAAWIPTTDIQAFVNELLPTGRPVEVEHTPINASWAIAVPSWERSTVAATHAWGTNRIDAYRLIEHGLNQKRPEVYDRTTDDRRVRNADATLAAQEKLTAIQERFTTWLWEDSARAERLATRYNRLFNSTVLPRWDGSHLELTASSRELHDHQKDAVWRIVQGGDTLLAHVVGAGKTTTMVGAGMELRRLGLTAKPLYVVPNHTLDQFAREAQQINPAGRILAADSSQLTKDKRRRFITRCATGDWDAVILTESAFTRIPLGADYQAAYLDRQIDALTEAISIGDADGGYKTVKDLEKARARIRERKQRLLASAQHDDEGLSFEALGVDYLFIDEAHRFKNLHTPTRIRDAAPSGASAKAQDLHMKITWMREQHPGGRVTFATGTPVANSVAELYVMANFLDPAGLEARGVAHFDAWAATFADTVTRIELDPSGGSYRMATRFARFTNLPELMAHYRSFADVQSNQDLDLSRPDLAGGQRQVVLVPATDELHAYVGQLVDRAEQVRSRGVDPTEDNMLKICTDGRLAALDLRLVGEHPADPSEGKIAACAEHVAAIYRREADSRYPTIAGGPLSETPGACQLVFCDLGTPGDSGRFNAYQALREELVSAGVPVDKVRFVHDATDANAKARLFAECRSGDAAVLVASTEKAGVGTNIQDRLVALHHLDAPWRPADVEQREGRILRQGNLHAHLERPVEIHAYVTEGSFDVYMWQTLERKAAFIAQITGHDATDRQIDDIDDDTVLSYAEIKAIATGNPVIVEKAEVDAELGKLRRLHAAHGRDQHQLARKAARLADHASHLGIQADQVQQSIDQHQDTSGDKFRATMGGVETTDRREAGELLTAAIGHLSTDDDHDEPAVVGKLGGFRITATTNGLEDHEDATITIQSPYPLTVNVDRQVLHDGDPARLITRLEHRLRTLPRRLEDLRAERQHQAAEAEAGQAGTGKTFAQQDRLADLTIRQQELAEEISALEAPAAGEHQSVEAEPVVPRTVVGVTDRLAAEDDPYREPERLVDVPRLEVGPSGDRIEAPDAVDEIALSGP